MPDRWYLLSQIKHRFTLYQGPTAVTLGWDSAYLQFLVTLPTTEPLSPGGHSCYTRLDTDQTFLKPH